jgi:bacteriophage exclusion system BrxB-like protein
MSSLKERIELLENDLNAVPPRISVYHDLPFAIVRYDPADEWALRNEVRLLATRLEAIGKDVHIIPISQFLWKAIEETEGLEAVVELERERGYLAAQDQVTTYLSDRDWKPLASLLAERLAQFDPKKSVTLLTRVAAMAPGIYHVSKLLDQMQGKTKVTTILFYPGSIEGTTGLLFMDLKDRAALGNYRVKIYG